VQSGESWLLLVHERSHSYGGAEGPIKPTKPPVARAQNGEMDLNNEEQPRILNASKFWNLNSHFLPARKIGPLPSPASTLPPPLPKKNLFILYFKDRIWKERSILDISSYRLASFKAIWCMIKRNYWFQTISFRFMGAATKCNIMRYMLQYLSQNR